MAAIPPAHIHRVGLFVCLVVGCLLIAHSINAFVAERLSVLPEPGSGSLPTASPNGPILASYSPTQAIEDIRSSGLFLYPSTPQQGGTNGAQSDRRGSSGPATRGSLGLSGKLRLIGVVMGDQRGVFAIIEELASKNQSLYRLREPVLDVGEVTDIRRNGVVIRQGGIEELLELSGSDLPPVAAGSPNPASTSTSNPTPSAPLRKVIDRREVEQAMNDLPKLLSQARAVPHMVNGTIGGFRLDYIAPASFYERIGVQTGDVLQRVNGVDIRDPSTMLNLLQQLKSEQIVKLDVLRNNQRSTITYELR